MTRYNYNDTTFKKNTIVQMTVGFEIIGDQDWGADTGFTYFVSTFVNSPILSICSNSGSISSMLCCTNSAMVANYTISVNVNTLHTCLSRSKTLTGCGMFSSSNTKDFSIISENYSFGFCT